MIKKILIFSLLYAAIAIQAQQYTYKDHFGVDYNSSSSDEQWYLDIIKANEAWEITKGISEVQIAYICANGVYWLHEDLGEYNSGFDNIRRSGAGSLEQWQYWNIPDTENTDDDNNGYSDDWRGIYFENEYSTTHNTNVTSTVFHSTWIAGIMSAKNDDLTGILGISGGSDNMGVSLMIASYNYVGHDFTLIGNALNYAIENGARVIILDGLISQTQYAWGSVDTYLNDAFNGGIFVIAPTGWNGNDNLYFPSSYTNGSLSVFSVGASTKPDIDGNEYRHTNSNYGWGSYHPNNLTNTPIDLVAPGEQIYTTSHTDTDEYHNVDGVSPAAAMVASTVGLMLSVNPDLTYSEIETILHETAEKIGQDDYYFYVDGWHQEVGYGRLNTYKAVCAALATAPPLEVSNGATWDEPKFTLNDVVVPSGYTLTITSTVYFGSEARLIIEPGATVTVNGGLLTNYKFCGNEDNLWPGVEVWGNSAKSQYINPSDEIQWQGKLILTTGATIENAEYGVLLSARDDSPDGFNDNKNGGIISVTNSGDPTEPGAIFLNNKKAVVFRIYNNFNPVNPSVPMNNISKLENCHFDINTNYLDGAWWYSHIYAFGVNGVRIAGCTFDNNKTTVPMGHGINAWGAGFRVEALCNSTSSPCPPAYLDKCTFTNFAKGINNNSSGAKTIYVSDADFFNNSYGVILDAVNNATIIFCNFEIGYNYNEKDECDDLGISRGIDISNSFGFTIEENNFTKAQGIPAGEYMGIRINESHTRYDLIYRNNLNDLDFGNYAEGINRNNPNIDQDGLEYQCNINSGNDIDFIVTGPVNTYPQIRTFQGLISKAAGNKFSTGATMHFQNDGTQVIDYFYWNTIGEVPIYYTPFYVQPILATSSNGCLSNYGGGSGGDDRGMVLSDEERLEQELIFAEASSNYDNVTTLYENLKDGGNTEALQTNIELSWPQDMWELRAELLGHSPHLSKEVLMTAADKTDVLPDAVLFEILSANPDELRKDDLIQYLENKENPLPEYMVSILRDLAAGITYKTVLQQQMADYHAKKTHAAYRIVRSILLDDEMDHTDLRNWLDNIGGIRADEMIIQSFIAEGNYTDAISLMSLLPSLYNLEGNTLASYQDYSAMINLLKSVDDDSRNISEFTESEKSVVIDIAENGYGNGKDMARSILNFAYGHTYCDCPQPLNSAGTKSAAANKADYQKAFGAKVNVEPNPVGEWAVFNYELPGDVTEGIIKIIDVSGRVIDEIIVYGPVGQKLWDTRNIKNGSYLYSITVNGINTGGKIIVNK